MAERGREAFEREVLVHLDAAYGFARRLAGSPDDAADIVQEACLRAWRAYGEFRDGSAKTWLLTITRNTAFSWLGAARRYQPTVLDHDDLAPFDPSALPVDPEAMLRRIEDRALLDRLVQGLPQAYREVLILRELEELSYREIATVIAAPLGTVMSRLARARQALQEGWRQSQVEGTHGLRR